jgi:hypothetical protein
MNSDSLLNLTIINQYMIILSQFSNGLRDPIAIPDHLITH